MIIAIEKQIKELEKKIVNGKEALDWMINQIRDELKCEPENLDVNKIMDMIAGFHGARCGLIRMEKELEMLKSN